MREIIENGDDDKLIEAKIRSNPDCLNAMYRLNGFIPRNAVDGMPRAVLNGYTPLMHAAKLGRIKIVKLLIKYKADPNFTVKLGEKYTCVDLAIKEQHFEVVSVLLKYGAPLQRQISQETISRVREKGYDELADLLLEQNRALQESNVHPSVRELKVSMAEIGSNLDDRLNIHAHRQDIIEAKQTTQEDIITTHGVEIGRVHARVDEAHSRIDSLEARMDQFFQKCNEIQNEVGMDDGLLSTMTPYNRTLYLTLHWRLMSTYSAAFITLGNNEGMVPNSRQGTLGVLGSATQTASSFVPIPGVKEGLQLFGRILNAIDARTQYDMVANFAKLARDQAKMGILSRSVAQKIVEIIRNLDIEKMEKDTTGYLEKFVGLFSQTISFISSNTDRVNADIQNPTQAVTDITAATSVQVLQNKIVNFFAQREETISPEQQLGKKHADIIFSVLISRIYSGENIVPLDHDINRGVIIGFIGTEIITEYDISLATTIPSGIQSLGGAAATANNPPDKEKHKCIVSYILETPYDNEILNNPELLKVAYKIGGVKAASKLIDLGQDEQLANAIVEASKYYKPEYVISTILLTNKNNYAKKDIIFSCYRAEAITTSDQEHFLQNIEQITEHNFFLNNPKGIQFIQAVGTHFDERVLLTILELGKDFDIAEQIVNEAELQSIDKVVYTLLGKEVPEVGSTYNLENIISKDELSQLQLVPNGIFNSWSNKPYLKIVEYIDNLAKNLDSMLNVGKSGNQIAIIITLLEEWINFAASGQRLVSIPYFYHGNNDEDYPYGGGSGSGGENYNNSAESFALHQGFITTAIMPLYNETYNITDYQM